MDRHVPRNPRCIIFSVLISLCTDRLPSSALRPTAFSVGSDDAPSRSPRSQPTTRSPPSTASILALRLSESQFSFSIDLSGEENMRRRSGGVLKRRVYGLGSLAKMKRRYKDLGASTSRESMVRHSEFDVVVQRLVQFEAFVQSQLGMCMDFEASNFQAPPTPPPREHHQQVGMDSARLTQQQHDDDDETSMIG
ncbi:hypothetical protein Syun_001051 [Stephania yunnanensis]|uniref:Uncharacterized protein n=1 Tax=Stephania yunnanensis TaxID=152371 RepID=A0AAP0QAH8_9MAGN